MVFAVPILDSFFGSGLLLEADKRRTGTSWADHENAQKPKNIAEFSIDSKNAGA